MWDLCKLFFIFFLFTQILTVSYCVHVKVEQGELKGKRESRITDDGEYFSFKGIPYAAPPIGQLRFKDPQPPLSWTKVRDAQSHGAICPQNNINTGGNVTGDEDCLFLNVYTPTLTPETPLPVMFFIHGGYYVTGSGNDDRFGPDFLMDRDVVLVTINYRLGVLGFLSLDIPEALGNVGLKDQVAAMEWVKKNIANFGGDPDNVTIFGQSVGGSAVTLHLLSPLSRGLFKRAIAMSGSFFKDFQLPFEHVRRAFLLTKQLGKCTKDPNEALRHLQQASVNDLIQAKPFVLYNERPRRELLEIMFFRPIIEKPMESGNFLTEDPMKLLIDRKVNEVDFIFGHTGEEGVYRGVTQKDYLLKYDPEYNEFLVPVTIANANSASEVLNIGTKIRQHYFTECEIKDDTKNMKEIIQFYTDFTYNHHFYRFLELWVQGGFKVYFYVFTGYTERNVYGKLGNIYGFENATHADDLAYLFSGSAYPTLQKENPSYQIIEQTCDLYTNFAKYGKPTPNDTVWLPYDKENTNYLLIDLELTPKILGEAPVVQFWRKIYEDAGLKFAT